MEEDAALCDVVKKALEGKGVLAQIRASLRAAVFTAVDEHERSSGVHVPNPAALGVKHDAGGRLALQLVVDFLEHWELHQTLSILKLETDVPEEDLLSREELESTVMSGTGVAGGEGETKSREGKPAPVILRLLAGGRSLSQGAEIRVSPRDANGETPSGLGSGVGSSCAPGSASLSASYRNGGGEYPSEMSGPHGDHGGSSEEKDEGAREEEGAGRGSKESEQEIAGPNAGDVSSRVTMRKRRGGDGVGHSIVGDGASGGEGPGSNGASNGRGVEATDEPSPGTPSDSAPEEAPPATTAEREDQAGSAGGRFPLAMPPPADHHQQQQQDSDSEIRSEASEGSPASCPAGDERRGLEDDMRRPGLEGGAEGRGWGRHYAGGMDESDYHFSEDAVSASADSPVRPGTGNAPGLFEGASDGGGGDDGSAVAKTAAAEAKDTGGGLAGDLSGAREEQGGGGHEFECRSGEVGANGRLSGDGDGQSNAGSMGFESSSIDVDGGAGGGGGSALRESEGGGGGDEKEAQGGRSSGGSVGEEVGGARSDGGRSSDWGDESDDYYEDDDFHGDDDDNDHDDHGDDDGGNGDVDARGVALGGSTVAVTSTGGGQGEEELEEAVVEEEVEERGGTLLVPGGDEGGHAEEDVLFDVDAEGSEREDRDPEEERGGNEEDLEWEARIGLSADSSVVVGGEEGEEDDLDMQSYEIEDVQSV
ncbi:unnamed protein product [Scytosiphon promiscuus]